jgi:hypothetical protein
MSELALTNKLSDEDRMILAETFAARAESGPYLVRRR